MRIPTVIALWLLCTAVSAQDEATSALAKQLAESRANYPAMRPQVFFSQDKYAPGDTAFFRLFVLTESERILADRSLLNLELIHPKGYTCARQVVASRRFGTANQLILPDSLSPGYYEVRLFSDRMTLAYGLSHHLMIVGEKQLIRQASSKDGVQFFPEGGHLITGALNRVVIRAMGKIPASASLFSDQGRVMPVSFDESGLAEVQFVPQQDRKFHLEHVIGETVIQTSLPDTEPDAVALRIYKGPRKTVVLDLNTGPEGPRSAILVLVSSRQIWHSQAVQFKSGRATILAASNFFPEGYSEVFVLDNERSILAYRPMYVPVAPVAQILLPGLPESVALRQDVKVEMKIVDREGKPMSAGVAIAVIPDDVRRRPIRTPDPTLELRQAPPLFDWTLPAAKLDQEIIATPVPQRVVPEFPPLLHHSNLVLTGKAYSKDRSALPYLSRIIIYLHEDKIQYETGIDGVGNFEFSKIYDFMGADKVYYRIMNQGKDVPRVGVEWMSTAADFFPLSHEEFSEGIQADNYGILRKRKRLIENSFNYFLAPDTMASKVTNYNETFEREFRNADITVNPGEYVSFETMRELMLEVIPTVRFRVHGKDSLVRVDLRSPLAPMRYAEVNPLFIIDGYMTTNTRYLMSLSPKDIVAVKVINDIDKLNRFQNLAKDGILFIQTRIPERTRRDLEKELHTMEGFSPTIPMATRYPTKPRVPDLRSLLYWTPLLAVDSTGTTTFNFRTSDLPGTYWIRIMGTTTTGHLVTAEQKFTVNFK